MEIQQLNLEINRNTLPIFKVTMLGDSGSGKTTFMSSMYTKLQQNEFGVRIRADHDIDLEMRENFMNLYRNNEFPLGTTMNKIEYSFELLFKNEPIAKIDWVDYRGGAMVERVAESEDAQTLIKRIKESHCVMWMLDLSSVGKKINSLIAREFSGALRMSNFCLDALRTSKTLRSIIFVRTKSDEVRSEDGEADWHRACDELDNHLENLREFNGINYTALVPVSSSGRLDSNGEPEGDDPHNVEWALILALAFMYEKDLREVYSKVESAEESLHEVTPKNAFKFIRDVTGIKKKTRKEIGASENLSELMAQMMGMEEAFKQMVERVPNDIKIFKEGE